MTDQSGTSGLRAVAHPLRLQMLSLLTGAALSAAEVARELGITHANASYHLRVLLEAGELVVTGEEKIRGGVAKRYRHDWRQGLRPGRPAPAGDKVMYVRATADELVRRYALRAKGPASFTDAELWVDPEVYATARQLLEEASSLVHGAARPPRTEGTVRMNMTTALFPMSPLPEEPA
jgi:DNA-binding transcriptional ArsR family regulator